MKKLMTLIGLIALVATGVCAGSLTLAWDGTADPYVAGYRIYIGSASRIYTNSVTVVGGTNATLTIPTTPWRVYYFAATAYATNGLESEYSNELVWTNTGFPPYNLRIRTP